MTTDKFREILGRVWNRDISADDAWELVDAERVNPYNAYFMKDFGLWLPLDSTKDNP